MEKFVASAAEDPHVLAIKMTLYRTGDNSPFIRSLIKAAEKGKQVVALVELKARFDEQRNIVWAQKLEDAGVHVVYGILGLKTHTKTTLVVRQESDGEIMSYVHVGTGNYHSQTSNLILISVFLRAIRKLPVKSPRFSITSQVHRLKLTTMKFLWHLLT